MVLRVEQGKGQKDRVVVSLLLTVTLLAAFVPARRAALVNPTEALRHE